MTNMFERGTPMSQFERTERLIGTTALSRLRESGVALFGLGGVGSFAAEALMRAGIGRLLLVDGDVIDETNLNRQLYALHSNILKKKTELAKARAMDINPSVIVNAEHVFYDANTQNQFDLSQYDYVIDAIDSVTSKLLLIENCHKTNVPIISCMGTGNKLDPSLFEVSDIKATSICPLARVMRRELKKRGIDSLQVVYSKELPHPPKDGARAPGSISFVPSAAGLLLASTAIRALIAIP